jgi:hypothetical protein
MYVGVAVFILPIELFCDVLFYFPSLKLKWFFMVHLALCEWGFGCIRLPAWVIFIYFGYGLMGLLMFYSSQKFYNIRITLHTPF